MYLYSPNSTTAILYCITLSKSSNLYRMLLLYFSHVPVHITPTHFDLQWSSIFERIKFNILLLTYKAPHLQSPTYIQELITRYSSSRTLHSSSTLRFNPVNFNLNTYGSRAFSVSAPELWNKLPNGTRSCNNPSLCKLKTYLFKCHYFSKKNCQFILFLSLISVFLSRRTFFSALLLL